MALASEALPRRIRPAASRTVAMSSLERLAGSISVTPALGSTEANVVGRDAGVLGFSLGGSDFAWDFDERDFADFFESLCFDDLVPPSLLPAFVSPAFAPAFGFPPSEWLPFDDPCFAEPGFPAFVVPPDLAAAAGFFSSVRPASAVPLAPATEPAPSMAAARRGTSNR